MQSDIAYIKNADCMYINQWFFKTYIYTAKQKYSPPHPPKATGWVISSNTVIVRPIMVRAIPIKWERIHQDEATQGPWPRQLSRFSPFPMKLKLPNCHQPLECSVNHVPLGCPWCWSVEGGWVMGLVFSGEIMDSVLVLQRSCTWYFLPITQKGQYDIVLVQSPAGKSNECKRSPHPSPWQISPFPLSGSSQDHWWLFALLST